MRFRRRVVTQIVYLDVRSKDVYIQRPLLQADELIYDSTSDGRPIFIPDSVLSKVRPDRVPLIFGHERKNVEIGYVDNFNYDSHNKVLLGDIHVYPRWNCWVLQQFAEGNNGLSTEFKSLDKDEQFFIRIVDLNLERVAVVPTPAAHVARVY